MQLKPKNEVSHRFSIEAKYNLLLSELIVNFIYDLDPISFQNFSFLCFPLLLGDLFANFLRISIRIQIILNSQLF